jgi:transposase
LDVRRDLYRLAGVDLTQVDGLQVLTVQTILSEIGLARHRWPTAKHVPSWLGLAPSQDISGGKTLRTGTKKPTNRAATAFRLAAQRLHASHSALGGCSRRRRAKHGAPKAIVATAHTLARIVSHLLTHRQAYIDPGADDYEEKYRDRAILHLKRKARQLGLDLVPVTI